MGIVRERVVFDGRVPALADICAKITDTCGRSVIVLDSTADELYDWHASIAFECVREGELELYAYRPGAVRQFCNEELDDTAQRLLKAIMQGANEQAGKQSVYLQAYVGQELTLFETTVLALESLGGRPSQPICDDERREFGRVISESELRERHRDAKRKMRRVGWAGFVLLPVIIPMVIVQCVWDLITTPFQIWRAKQILDDIGNDGQRTPSTRDRGR